MLKTFFKPKWLHKDPKVRSLALQALDSSQADNQAAFHEVATTDSDASVRRVAINHMSDLDGLWAIVQNESDTGTQITAQQHFIELLAGIAPEAPPLAVRLAHLAGVVDLKIIDDIARRGVDSELRRAALERVEREALLGDIALNDTDAELRYTAVQRLSQSSTLKRVAKIARTKDKRVSGVARDKLEQLAAAAERPERMRKRAVSACTKLEALTQNTNPGAIKVLADVAEAEWSVLMDECECALDGAINDTLDGIIDAALKQRYEQAHAALALIYEKHEKQIVGQQVLASEMQSVRSIKGKLCDQLEAIVSDLQQHTVPGTDDEASTTHALGNVQAEWDATTDLTLSEDNLLNTRYHTALSIIESCLDDIPRYRSAQKAYDEILLRAQDLHEATSPLRQADIINLEKRLKSIVKPRHYELDVSLRQRIDALFTQLKARHAQDLQNVQLDVEQLKTLVADIEQAVSDGVSRQAAQLHREAQQLFDNLPSHEAGLLRKQGIVDRWKLAEKSISEMFSWKKWAGAPVKERLVDEMETLVKELSESKHVDYHNVSQQIQQAREQWKSLGATDNTKNDLWQRFNTACNAAHVPCLEYFKAERGKRTEHAQHKRDICDNLEQFIAQTDWQQPNWKIVKRVLRVARKEWSQIGPADRAQGKKLGKRFNALMDDLAAKLGAERVVNKDSQQRLINQMQQLADSIQEATTDSPAVTQAVAQAKQLQQQWKTLGTSGESNSLWNTFRTQCDRIFARRQALHEAQDQERLTNLEHKSAVCTKIEALAQLAGDEFAQGSGSLQQLKTDFEQSGPVPKQATDKIQQRYLQACQAIDNRRNELKLQLRQQAIQLLVLKAQHCTDLDNIIAAVIAGSLENDAAGTELISAELLSAQEQWQAHAALDDAIEKPMSARFQSSIETLQGLLGDSRDDFVNRYNQQRQENLIAKELLCLRAEISADFESPPEYQQQRMQFQLEQLAQRMSTGEPGMDTTAIDAEVLSREWHMIGAVPESMTETQQTRFERIRQELADK